MPKNKRLWLKVVLSFAGAVCGFLYWKFIGCTNESCPLKSVWYFATIWGLMFGYVIGDILGSFLWRRAAENE